jgi:hypothetical protein
MDFVNGNYWDGTSEVTLSDLIGQNPSNWGPFDPETDLTEAGIVSGSPILVGEALARAVAGCTFLFGVNVNTDPGTFSTEAIKSADFSTDLYCAATGPSTADLMVKDFITNVSNHGAPSLQAGQNKIAFTLSQTKLSASVNGAAVRTIVATVPTAIDEIVMSMGFGAIVSVAIYSQMDDADLPGLST